MGVSLYYLSVSSINRNDECGRDSSDDSGDEGHDTFCSRTLSLAHNNRKCVLLGSLILCKHCHNTLFYHDNGDDGDDSLLQRVPKTLSMLVR